MPVFAVDGPMSRGVRKVATSKGFRKVAPKFLPQADRVLHHLTRGRVNLSQAIVPCLVLTTIGQKSGLPRESPLACVPDGEGAWYVVGSNFGQEKHPAWTGNLLAHPEASVDYRKRTVAVTAQLLTDDQKAEVWPRLLQVWPAYDDYVAVSGRNLRVFRLVVQ